MLKLSVLAIAVLVLAGCTTTDSGPRIWYDRKYNEYRYLRGHVPPQRSEVVAAVDQKQAMCPERRMQGDMDRIHGTADPKERQRLMEEHMQAMLGDAEMMRACMNHMTRQGPDAVSAPAR